MADKQGQNQDNLQRRVSGLKDGARDGFEFNKLVDVWFSDGPREAWFRNAVVQSYRDNEGETGMYARALREFQSAGAQSLLNYFVELGLGTSNSMTGGKAAVSPTELRKYWSDLSTKVSSGQVKVSNLERELQEARAEVARLRPFEQNYNALVGELDFNPTSGIDALLAEYRPGDVKSDEAAGADE